MSGRFLLFLCSEVERGDEPLRQGENGERENKKESRRGPREREFAKMKEGGIEETTMAEAKITSFHLTLPLPISRLANRNPSKKQ